MRQRLGKEDERARDEVEDRKAEAEDDEEGRGARPSPIFHKSRDQRLDRVARRCVTERGGAKLFATRRECAPSIQLNSHIKAIAKTKKKKK